MFHFNQQSFANIHYNKKLFKPWSDKIFEAYPLENDKEFELTYTTKNS